MIKLQWKLQRSRRHDGYGSTETAIHKDYRAVIQGSVLKVWYQDTLLLDGSAGDNHGWARAIIADHIQSFEELDVVRVKVRFRRSKGIYIVLLNNCELGTIKKDQLYVFTPKFKVDMKFLKKGTSFQRLREHINTRLYFEDQKLKDLKEKVLVLLAEGRGEAFCAEVSDGNPEA
jgi:hypothetical protein